jgi:hypothetical protein
MPTSSFDKPLVIDTDEAADALIAAMTTTPPPINRRGYRIVRGPLPKRERPTATPPTHG